MFKQSRLITCKKMGMYECLLSNVDRDEAKQGDRSLPVCLQVETCPLLPPGKTPPVAYSKD